MIEWLATSYFSFLEGASAPESLAPTAFKHGYAGVAVADRMSLSGVVRGLRGAEQVRTLDPKFFYANGVRLHFDQADPLFVYPLHRASHAALCRFLSDWSLAGMKAGEKGLTPLPWRHFRNFLKTRDDVRMDFILISVSGRFYPWVNEPKVKNTDRVQTQDKQAPAPSFSIPPTTPGHSPFWLMELCEICGRGDDSALSLAYPLTFAPGVEDLLAWTEEHALRLNIPLLATSLPLFATPDQRDLCDLLTSIRHTKKLSELGYLRQANGERRLLTKQERTIHRVLIRERLKKHAALNDPVERGRRLAERHHFSLFELRYHYPRESVPAGETPSAYLERLVREGARERFGGDIPPKVEAQFRHELSLIAKLEYEDYFLTIWDVLRYARSKGILFQGRGSAANSAVCFCLGITAIDPVRMDFLFERFISLERREPPDIDVDFEHERREEVIQEVYARYGREHAAMVASYICFRDRMAVRETAKALGIPLTAVDEIVTFMGREGKERLVSQPLAPFLVALLKRHAIAPKTWRQLLELSERLEGIPRHLSIHTGGFVLSSERLSEQCILEPARMENRSVLPWDKDDVDFLGWMKVDLLSLGMLTAIRKCLEIIAPDIPPQLALARIPSEDPEVYRTMRRADTVGVFQIESRAQMNMLPRLAPKCFYDIVVEVAIVRPGPIQGGMVHPYIKRRQGLEPITYDHPDLVPILEKTYGVPIFQEQVMKIAIAVADFQPGEADLLRKAMSGAWRSKSRMHEIRERLYTGMAKKGITSNLADRLYKQIEGFGDYGFPESHAASFALLTYASTWLKRYHPAEFLLALINSQPMGFYSPRELVGDAERHGVIVRPVDLLHSKWDCTLAVNPDRPRVPHVRLGLRLVPGLSRATADLIERLQIEGVLAPGRPTPNLRDLSQAGLDAKALGILVRANVCRSIASTPDHADPRRAQLWEILSLKGERHEAPLLIAPTNSLPEAEQWLQGYDEWTALMRDFQTIGLTPTKHPATYAREQFFKARQAWCTAEELYRKPNGKVCAILGLLTIKQRPPTAGGVTFLTLEDETGFMNLVLYREVYEACRLTIEQSPLLAAIGYIQKSEPRSKSDLHTSAVSFQVQRLWNPFLAHETGSVPQDLRFKPRHYH